MSDARPRFIDFLQCCIEVDALFAGKASWDATKQARWEVFFGGAEVTLENMHEGVRATGGVITQTVTL